MGFLYDGNTIWIKEITFNFGGCFGGPPVVIIPIRTNFIMLFFH